MTDITLAQITSHFQVEKTPKETSNKQDELEFYVCLTIWNCTLILIAIIQE